MAVKLEYRNGFLPVASLGSYIGDYDNEVAAQVALGLPNSLTPVLSFGALVESFWIGKTLTITVDTTYTSVVTDHGTTTTSTVIQSGTCTCPCFFVDQYDPVSIPPPSRVDASNLGYGGNQIPGPWIGSNELDYGGGVTPTNVGTITETITEDGSTGTETVPFYIGCFPLWSIRSRVTDGISTYYSQGPCVFLQKSTGTYFVYPPAGFRISTLTDAYHTPLPCIINPTPAQITAGYTASSAVIKIQYNGLDLISPQTFYMPPLFLLPGVSGSQTMTGSVIVNVSDVFTSDTA